MPVTRVGDIDLYHEQHGSGPDLLCIAGLGVDHRMWDVARLSPHFRVTIFDNRGIGRSTIAPGPYGIEQMADDAAGLCDQLGIEHAAVVGHSMGGHIAQQLAIRRPRLVDRLVLACSSVTSSALSELATAHQLHLIDMNAPLRVRLEAFLPVLLSVDFLEDEGRREAFVQAVLDDEPQPPAGYAAQVAALRAHDTTRRVGEITCPTLVVGCGEDRILPPRHARQLAEQLPDARLQVIERCGHNPFLEQPDVFYEAVLTFLLSAGGR